jgi:hypothetical protein
LESGIQFLEATDQGLRHRRGGLVALVGNKIGHRNVDLVPDADPDRFSALGDRLPDGLAIETRQFQRRAPAPDQADDIDVLAIQHANGPDHLSRRAFPLHRGMDQGDLKGEPRH